MHPGNKQPLRPIRRGIHKRSVDVKCIVRTIALVVAMFVTLPLSTLVAQATGSFASLPAGHAYAEYVSPTVSTIVNSGVVLAPAGISCTEASTTSTNYATNLSVGSLASSSTANTVVTNTQTATDGTIQSSVTIHNVNILAGLIQAPGLQATVASTANASGTSSVVKQASFSGLTIAGVAAPTNPAPNTVRSLLGIGTITLNEQSLSNGSQSTTGSVNMIDIHISVANNLLGLPLNTQIIIGHVDSSENIEPAPMTVQAESYGLYAGASNQVVVSPLAPASTGCAGGSGQTNGASKTLTFGSTGVITDTASGTLTSSGSTATGQSTIAGLNLFGGLIKADKVVANVQSSLSSSGVSSGSTSVTLINATIAGSVQSQHPAPNTAVTLPGLGYVTLNEPTHILNSSNAIEGVYAMDIHVTTPLNAFGLAVGTRITVAAASATISTY